METVDWCANGEIAVIWAGIIGRMTLEQRLGGDTILYPEEIFIRNEEEIKKFSNEKQLRFVTNRLTSKEWLKDSL